MKLSFWDKVRMKLIYVSCKQMGTEYTAGHLIFPAIIDENSVIVDCGGNVGNFSHQMIRQFNVKVYCIEANARLLEDVFPNDKLEKINVALADKKGEMEFVLSENSESNSFNPVIASIWGKKEVVNVATNTLAGVKMDYNIPAIDLLKIDIEGAEILLFKSLSNADISEIPQISVEFHEFLDKDLEKPTHEVLQRMAAAGFRSIVYSAHKYSDVLFLNKNIRLNIYQNFWYLIHSVVRYRG